MSEHPLTDEEIKALRKLAQIAREIEEQTKYTAARRLVMQTWRQAVIGFGAVLGVGLLIWQTIKDFTHSVLQ